MSRPVPLILLLLAAGPVRAGDPPLDAFGDPLPPGAVLRLGTTRLRHAALAALAFTADKKLVSFGRDYVLRTWDPATGKQLAEWVFEKDKVYRSQAGYLSADAKRLAVQYDGRVKVFDIATGKELAVIKLTDRSEAHARFSPDGERLAVVDQQGKFQVCDVGANTCRDVANLGNSHTSNIAFSRDGKRLAVANFQHGVVAWELATGRELVRYNPGRLNPVGVDFDSTGEVLAVLPFLKPRSVDFVPVSAGPAAPDWSAPKAGEIKWARFAPDGAAVLLGGADGVQWFDPKVGKVIRTLDGPGVFRPAFSAEGTLVASGGRHAIRVWEAASGKGVSPPAVNAGPQEEVGGVAVSPDGRVIATKGAESGAIDVWGADGTRAVGLRSFRWGGPPRSAPTGRTCTARPRRPTPWSGGTCPGERNLPGTRSRRGPTRRTCSSSPGRPTAGRRQTARQDGCPRPSWPRPGPIWPGTTRQRRTRRSGPWPMHRRTRSLFCGPG